MATDFDYDAGKKAADNLFAAMEQTYGDSAHMQLGFLQGLISVEAGRNPALLALLEKHASDLQARLAKRTEARELLTRIGVQP